MGFEIGIDIGGTFTDAVCRAGDGSFRRLKVASTPDDPARAVGTALDRLLPEGAAEVVRLLHGTTVATNAILEGKAARTGLITTAGFADVLELGRMTRASNYDLVFGPQTPVHVVPAERRLEVPERIGPDGAVLLPLDEAAVAGAARALAAQGVQAVAICFLFGFLNPAHERRAREIVAAAAPGLAISLSSEVDPAIREYERTCATVFDAALKPVLDAYLGRIEAMLAARGVPAALQVMHSRGGLLGAAAARARPIRLTLSGPSAAAIGAASVLREAGHAAGISIDIGGTSADIAVIEGGRPVLRQDGSVAGIPVRVPTADVLAIAAGGGSIAWLDAAGGLHVGPHSAGADPGPACYRRGGTRPTVLDASVVLGLVDPARFAGGTMPLDPEAAAAAIREQVAAPLGLSLEEAAAAIHRITNAALVEAVRRMTVGRGSDPRALPLVPAGGGGGLHAAAIAEELGMDRLVVPIAPGVLAATGLLEAPLEHDAGQGFFRAVEGIPEAELRAAIEGLTARCAAAMARDGARADATEVSAEASFVGQGHTLQVGIAPDSATPGADLRAGFIAAHRAAYGHTRDAPVRLVTLRVVQRAHPRGVALIAGQGAAGPEGERRAWLGEGFTAARILRGLAPGAVLAGPAILETADSTLLVPPGWRLSAAATHLLMERAAP
ncbi:hydantoinase/oxoprolinase family protein [Paracraurococcus lichenis]|uniref:Hydantoinase/oxoprolinase family protein n=1 Tax=Paracraurococcus lichenis TaxID=3064888 RepID=A0ABT9E6C0_9PROT|nr:hydantoinase/oxoprolinase family protein [Paracraurococcus sp. LOR1-02]MDO9711620.1 hydantoinase/oxoprolinase family protein [Paracraurococcus sp. LOR1-02]